MPYFLSLSIVYQLSLRRLYLDEHDGRTGDLTLEALESDLLTNVLRADFLMGQANTTAEGRRQLESAIQSAKKSFSKRPVLNTFKNTVETVDMTAMEPILPRWYNARAGLEKIFPPESLSRQK